MEDRRIERVAFHLPGLEARQVDLDHRNIVLANLGALLRIDCMIDQIFDRELEALVADKRVGLERADLMLGKHCVEVVGARREHRLPDTFFLKDQGGQSERLRRYQQFLGIKMERGLPGAQRVGPVREVSALVDRLAQRQDLAAVQAVVGALSQAGDRRNVPRATIAAPCERHFV